MPFEDVSFDAVLGNSILHHLPPEKALGECYRVLKPGGFIWFSEPNMINPEIAIERNGRFIGELLQNTEYETAFVRWSIARVLREARFEDISVRPYDFLHPIIPAAFVNAVEALGRLLEKVPVVREVSGSLMITAKRPGAG